MTKSFLSHSLLAAGVLAFAGFAQAGTMTGSGETSMTPTALGDSYGVQVHGYSQQRVASTGSGETSMTATTRSMGAGPAYRTHRFGSNGHQARGLTGSGETSLTPTTETMGVPSPTAR